MRVLVLEYVTGGGLGGRRCPAPLAREGSAMLAALLADLAAIPGVRPWATVDRRFPLAIPPGARVRPVQRWSPTLLRRLAARSDAVWPIAPESGGRLERLAATLERAGCRLLGPSAAAIRLASRKDVLARLLAARGIPVPPAARAGDYPLVVKPARGAGGAGVAWARDRGELAAALATARAAGDGGPVLWQRYLPGPAASVSLVTDGRRAVPLAVNRQRIRPGVPFTYRGGETPFDHPLAGQAVARAREACAAVPGLRGYVGVDVVLADGDAVVVELNPRLTTSYVGIRRSLDVNPAELALRAALGDLPAAPAARRRVRFLPSGAILREQVLTAPDASPDAIADSIADSIADARDARDVHRAGEPLLQARP